MPLHATKRSDGIFRLRKAISIVDFQGGQECGDVNVLNQSIVTLRIVGLSYTACYPSGTPRHEEHSCDRCRAADSDCRVQ